MSSNPNDLHLSDSLEDYIEAIYRIIHEKNQVKPKDIANALNVAGASVTGALRALTEKGLIHYAPYDEISLTPEGVAIAEDIYNRHRRLKTFLKETLGVPEEEANQTACRMEHIVSPSIIHRLVRFVEYIDSCPRVGNLWLSSLEKLSDPFWTPTCCENCSLRSFENNLPHNESPRDEEGKSGDSLPVIDP